MVSGEGSGRAKKEYNGKEYDYVFDIDIEEGKPPLKLPYNLTESAWDAARKFLEAHELPMTYYEQVANWISDNTKGAKIGADAQNANNGASSRPSDDPLGTERRYRPGEVASTSSSAFKRLPQRKYLDINEGNAQNAVNKINETCQQLRNSGKIGVDSDLSAEDVQALNKLAGQIQKSPRDPHPTDEQTTALLKVCTGWPTQQRVPGVALLARLAVSAEFVACTSGGDKTIVDTCSSAGLLLPMQTTANNAVHALRLFANLFSSDSGLLIADGTFDTTLNLARPFADSPESPAQARALATLYLNYSVLLTSSAPSSESSSREARAETLLRDIGALLESESPHSDDAEAIFRALCALGTLMALGDGFRRKMKMGVSGTLHFVGSKQAAQMGNVKEIVQEVRDEMK